MLYHVKVLSAQHVDVLSGVRTLRKQHGVAASQLFLWRKQYQEGSLTAVAAGEQVVPASELAAAMKQ
ncbi:MULTISPECIES: transposase, partial [Shigella]|uniref:transposase n=1 Tax=Shigella TaxID=620 RepID=UPI001EF0E165